MKHVDIFTDGACSGNPGPGGWGAVLRYGEVEKDGAFNLTKGMALLEGYESVRPLSPEEAAALPLLARGSALRFLLTRLYDWLHTPADALVKRKDPLEYLHKLRFHRGVRDIGAYGIE